MKTKLSLSLLLLLLCLLPAASLQAAASAATNRIRGSELSTTNRIYSSNTLFAVIFPYPHPYYTNGTMQISAEDLLESLKLLPGWTGGSGSANALTNFDTRPIELLSSLLVTGRQTNKEVVYLEESISQPAGRNADFGNLSAVTFDLAGTNVALSLHSLATNVLYSSNELYSFIIAAGISANTATNIARFWATNTALQVSNQLMLTLAAKTNPTLYGTVTIDGATASEVAAFGSGKQLVPVAGVSPTEIGFIDGLTENVQDGLDALVARAAILEAQTITNETTTALQIVNRILSLSPGILSNIVASGYGTPYIAVGTNGGTLSFATNLLWRGLVISNDAAGIYSIHAPASSAGSGTNNPVLISGPTLALIPNQTARGQWATNVSYPSTIPTGASNQSSMFLWEVQNTGTNTIHQTNSVAMYVDDYGSNVTTLAIPPLSKLIMQGWLNRSNEWVAIVRTTPYALTFSGAGVTMTTNHTTKTVDAAISGSGSGSSSFNETNITVSNTNLILLDVGSFDLFRLSLLTNYNWRVTNISSLRKRAQVYFQQDTNGQRLLGSADVAGGLLQTNANLQATTNANGLDVLEILPGFFNSNAIAWWPQNFQPRVGFTNSLDNAIYRASSIDLSGTNANVKFTGSAITMSGIGQALTFDGWVNPDTDGTTMYFVQGRNGTSGSTWNGRINTAGAIRFIATDGSGVTILDVTSPNNVADAADGWVHVHLAVDLSNTSNRELYIGGTNLTSSSTWSFYSTSGVLLLDRTDLIFGTDDSNGSDFNGQLGPFWIDDERWPGATYISSFINGGNPVNLGTDGSLPTGSAPDVYMKWGSGSLGVNSGADGGTGTQNGSPTSGPQFP